AVASPRGPGVPDRASGPARSRGRSSSIGGFRGREPRHHAPRVGGGEPPPPGRRLRPDALRAAARGRRSRARAAAAPRRAGVYARRPRLGVRRLRPLGAGGAAGGRPGAGVARAVDDGAGRGLPPVLPRRARLPAVSTYERRRRKRRSPYRRRVLWALAFVLVFGLGIALGQALEDNPQAAPTISSDR